MRHRASRLTPQPLTPGRRLTGVTAILSLVAASGVAVVIGTSFASAPKNLIANPGFEDNLTGWTKLSSPLHLARTTDDAHSGTYSAALSADKVGTAVLKDTPNTVKDTTKGAVYHASIWVKTATPDVVAVLRLREVKNGHLNGQLSKQVKLADGSWQQISIDYTARSDGGQLDWNLLARDIAVGHVLLADDAWLSADDPAPVADPSKTPTPTPSPVVTPPVVTPPVVTPPVVTPPVVTPPVVSGSTLFGSSIYQEPGESFATAYQRRVSTFGGMGIDRVFYPGLPKAWPGTAGYSGGPVVVELDPKLGLVGGGAIDTRFDFAPIAFALDGLSPDAPRWGAGYKRALRQSYTRTMFALAHTTSLPVESNNVTLDPTVKDAWGLPAARITFREHPSDQQLYRFFMDRCLELLAAAGAAQWWEFSLDTYYPAVHLLGTCRMGNHPGRSVVDRTHRAHDVPNLFLVDGSSLVTGGRGQPTCTIQALAYRAGAEITRLAKQGVLGA